jgi:hypothetical protein
VSIATAAARTHVCPGSWEYWRAANSRKPVKVTVVPSGSVIDSPAERFAAPTSVSRPRSIWLASRE